MQSRDVLVLMKVKAVSGEPMAEPGRYGFCSARGSPQTSPWGVPDSHPTLRRSRTRFNSWRGHRVFGSDVEGGALCAATTSTTAHFFRDNEQATKGIPVGNERDTRRPQGPRQQAPGREARPQRPVPMWQRKTIQAVLPEVRPLLMASIGTTTFRD